MRKLELQYREIIQGLESEVQKLRIPDEPKILTSNDALKVDNRLNEEFQSLDGQLKSLKDQYEADIKAMRHQNQLDVTREKEENSNYVEALTRQIA
jgi:cytochrome c biogenesis protein ResB